MSPPVESGTRLATIDRGPDEQLRIVWAEYDGHPYVGIRLWTADRLGRWWPDRTRGLSVRIRELGQVAEAIAAAIDRAEELRAAWTSLPPDHPTRRGLHRHRQARVSRRPVAGADRPAALFDEFA
jgi:hypothetical protein